MELSSVLNVVCTGSVVNTPSGVISVSDDVREISLA